MPDKTIVKPGSKVTIEIDEESGEAKIKTDAQAAEEDAPPHGIMPGAGGEDLLYRRTLPEAITFYDLGTRLRSVPEALNAPDYTRARALDAAEIPAEIEGGYNEYVEINLAGGVDDFANLDLDNPANSGTRGLQARILPALYAVFDKALLGSRAPGATDALDPLGHTNANVSGRKLPHCAPLPHVLYGSNAVLLDLILTPTGGGDAKTIPISEVDRPAVRLVGHPPGDPPPDLDASKWKKRKAATKDAQEHWNIINLQGGEAQGAGYLQTKGLGGSNHVKIDSRLFYQDFDTGDADNFKVTAEARFDADAVAFTYTGGGLEIYLKPQYLILAPARKWQRLATVYWSTYFRDFGTLDEPYRTKVGVYLGGGATIQGGISFAIQSKFDPLARRGSGTVSAVKPGGTCVVTYTVFGDLSGSGTDSGELGGGGEYCNYPGRYVDIAPGMLAGFGGNIPLALHTSGEIQYLTLYLPEQETIGVNAELCAPSAGRLPAYGRISNASWETLYYLNGATPDFAYALGYQLSFSTDARGEACFKRRPGWDSIEVVKELTGKWSILPMAYYGYVPEYHAHKIERELSKTRPPALQALPFGDFATLEADVSSVVGTIFVLLISYPPHRILDFPPRDAPIWQPATITWEQYNNSLDVIPSRYVPAGTLCGILKKGAAVFYVWRKTAQELSAPDYLREQATGLI